MNQLPKVTIITICYNLVHEIERTLQSIIEQTYPNIEYIVVDGGSTDGTLLVIERYADRITRYISEKDEGIYDAMNKGVRLSSGEYINFMNGGDWFKDSTVVERIFSNADFTHLRSFDLIYGNHEVYYPTFIKYKTALSADNLWKGMVCSHQSLFVKTALLKAHPFETRYQLSADFDFIFNRWADQCSFYHADLVVACYRAGGVSEKFQLKGKYQAFRIVFRRMKSLRVIFHYFSVLLITFFTVVIKKVLGEKLFEKAMKFKNASFQ